MLKKKINLQSDSDERLKNKLTSKIHNFAKELKLVECAIALLIQVFPGSYTSYLILTKLKNLQNPMIDQNAIFGDENWRISPELKEQSQTKA